MSGNGRVVDASEIGGETGVSGSDIERQIEQRRTIVGLEDNLAASAQLEGQADVTDPRRLDPGSGETVAFVPGQGVQVVDEGAAPTADAPAEPTGSQSDPAGAISASQIGGETGVSGSDIERALDRGQRITGLEESPAVAAQLEGQADVTDPRRLDPGSGETVAFVPGEGVQVVNEGRAPTADSPSGGQEPGQQQPQQPPDRQSGSGIGPGGVEGSEEAVPPGERDAPDNDSTEGIAADQTGRVEEGQGIDIPEIVDEQDAISATEIGGETGVSGSDIEEAVASGRPITDIEDAPAVAAQLENQFDITDPRQLREGGGQVLVPGEGLVVQPSEDQIQDRAQEVEQELVGEQITDISTNLNATGAEFREEDIQVSQTQDGSLRAELSPVGEARVQNIAERQQEEAAERQIEQELNTAFSDQDVSIDDSGEVVVSQNVRQEAIAQNIAEENPNVSEGDVSFENGEPVVQQPEQPAQPESGGSSPSPQQPGGGQPQVEQPEAADPADQLEEGEDFTIDDGQVNLTQRGAQELRGQREQEEGDVLTPVVRDFESITGFDLPGDTSEAGQAREQAADTESGELFGGRGPLEQRARGAARGFSDAVETAADPLGDALAANPLVDLADPSPDGFDRTGFENATTPQGTEEQRRSELFGGGLQGVGEIFNLPQLAVTANEGREVASAGISGTAVAGGTEDEFEQFESDAGSAGARSAVDATESAQEQPFSTAGQLVGSSVAATSALRAGRALGGERGANVAGAVVEPGETVLRRLRGTRGSSGNTGTSGETQLGSGGTGSLLDADELDAGRGPSRRARVRGRIERSDTAQRIQNQIDEFLGDERGQLQLRDRDAGQSADPDTSDFDPSRSEVLGGSTRDQLSSDIAERSRTQRRQNTGTFDGGQSGAGPTRPRSENARTEAQRRREQAQQQEVTQPPRTPGQSGQSGVAGDVAAGAGVGAGSLLDDAEQSAVDSVFNGSGTGTGTDSALDTGLDTGLGLGQEIGGRVGQEVGQELGQETRTELGSESRTELGQELGTESRVDVGTEIGTETRQEQRTELRSELGFEPRTRTETDVDLDDVFDDEQSGGVNFGAADDVFDTGVVQSLDDLDGGSDDALSGFDRLL